MLEKIADIEKALDADAYLSALTLTLTLPDICGKLEYPGCNNVKDRYISWLDTYYTPYCCPDYCNEEDRKKLNPEYMPKLDGTMCYQLRCSFLHSGSTSDRMPIDEFSLRVNGGTTIGVTWQNDDKSTMEKHIRLDIRSFCENILTAVKLYYEDNKDRLDFSKVNIKIVDIKAWYNERHK